MPIGDIFPSERKQHTDPDTDRSITQFTSAEANSYPLYYFIPSHTSDSRYLVFHSERSGYVQLYRLDT
jgi:Tol biopolymer transport system component